MGDLLNAVQRAGDEAHAELDSIPLQLPGAFVQEEDEATPMDLLKPSSFDPAVAQKSRILKWHQKVNGNKD